MQEKIFKRENERLYMDEKSLATSKGLIKNMGVNIPGIRPDYNQTDMNLIKDDDSRIDGQVRALQNVAQVSGKAK